MEYLDPKEGGVHHESSGPGPEVPAYKQNSPLRFEALKHCVPEKLLHSADRLRLGLSPLSPLSR